MMIGKRFQIVLYVALAICAAAAATGQASWWPAGNRPASGTPLEATAQESRTPPPPSRVQTRNAQAIREAILTLARRYRAPLNPEQLQTLADTIYQESQEAQVDPLLVAALISRESSFRPAAVSQAGAVGLMQLRPFVAKDVAARTDEIWSGPHTLREPKLNIRLGVRYYRELVDRFQGDERLALIAYNRGPSRLRVQIRNGGAIRSGYADSILRLYQELCENCGLFQKYS